MLLYKVRKIGRYLITICLCFSCAFNLLAQDTIIIRNAAFNKVHEMSLRDNQWLFHPEPVTGKNRIPNLNSSGWRPLHYTAFGKTDLPAGWNGIGWFAIWLKADNDVMNRELALRINHDGASQLFLDGRFLGGYGRLGTSAADMEGIRAPSELIPLWFNDHLPHLLTIHYANPVGVYANFYGFEVLLADYQPTARRIRHNRILYGFAPMCGAAGLLLSLLHLLLFFFYPQQKLNLYYALFVMLTGINGILIYEYYFTSYPAVQYHVDFMTSVVKVLLMWSGLVLLYMLDYGRLHKGRLLILSLVSATYILFYVYRYYIVPAPGSQDGFSFVFFIFSIDGFVSVYHLIQKGRRDAWLVATGVTAVTFIYFFALDDAFDLWPYGYNAMRVFVLSIGDLILPLCLSLYLALEFTRTNQNLAARLIEVESLSAEALARESEKRDLAAAEARRLEEMVLQRTAELKEKAEKLHDMNAAKSRLFINIAHEFRTPLTLIINPARELLSVPHNAVTEGSHRRILNNAERLLQLINQLMELSKLDHGLSELILEPLDLVALIREHIRNFESLVVQKGLTLHFRCKHQQLWVSGDRNKLDKILVNIISNAIKFTDAGRVEVFLHRQHHSNNSFTIQVRDTGKGIPLTKLPYIFTRFYQVDPAANHVMQGSGIGLAICKELAELMNGTITANSWEGAYTEITVQLPLEPITTILPETPNQPGEQLLSEDGDERPVILLIEDHDELRAFVSDLFAEHYRVFTAASGIEGISLGLELMPALIITDVMMPGKDGYELCNAFKKDIRTSHIPVIMLTAKADAEHRIQGLESGADAYLGKPFDKRELLALSRNLIALQRKQGESSASKHHWLNDPQKLPTMEQTFLAKVRSVVEKHLDNASYDTDQLAVECGLTRTQLHRKLKAVTGTAPGELIRVIRLQYAFELLQRRVATVAEVAYKVGYSSPASFSSSFSRHFGFPPKMVDGNSENQAR
jgi:signal transduction histidine kinase/DNA-binding response OmpR family regulator